MEERNKRLVNKYYSTIDANNLEEVFSLFEANISYNRCGLEIKGIEELKSFYFNNRTIRGKHEVKSVIAEGNTVATRGIFNGKNAKGVHVQLHFSEF